MSNGRISNQARQILGPGNLYSPRCKEWFWLKEDGTTAYLGSTLNEACRNLKGLEHQASSDEPSNDPTSRRE